jgi:hypothetical protein
MSSTETEYYATSESAKEVIYSKNLVDEVVVMIQDPFVIRCDNAGYDVLPNNHYNSLQTKHIDACWQVLREWVDNDILKIIFTQTKSNTAEIFTKDPTE